VMINSDNLCMSCMQDIGNEKQCPYCGFHADSKQIEPYLPIRTVLGNRYLVGKLLDYNGDGATYMAYDIKNRISVNIREFFPQGIAERDPKSLCVASAAGLEGIFGECLQSFIEMWRKIMKLSGLSALIKVLDILEGNGTCYVVTENVDGITLREYLLRNNVGYISWDQARPLLMPVLSTLGTLHSSGIIHRGISPSTLIVATDGKIRITGFSIGQVRSARSELKQQLFPGYAAFEQYGFEGRQGTWTDIYGFGAVLYRTLIGTDPIDATERITNDRLMVPGRFAEQLPAYVINGLVNALQILPEDRTRNVEELRAELSASPSAAASGYEYEPVKPAPVRQQPQRIIDEPDEEDYTSQIREEAQKRHNRSSVIIVIASIIIILALAFVVLWQTGVINLPDFEKTTVALTEAVDVPNFVGKDYEGDVIDNAYYKNNFSIEKNEIYSSDVEEGYVISQSLEVGSKVEKGSKIILTVSKGKEIITFPTSGINGVKYEQASQILTKLGFSVKKEIKLNTTGEIEGIVSDTSLEAGATYEKGKEVFLFVWGPQETTTQEEKTTEEASTEDTSEDEGNTQADTQQYTENDDENW